MQRIRVISVLAALAVLLGATAPAAALSSQEELVERSRLTIESLLADPDYEPLRAIIKDAKAVLIVPALVKGGFILGGEGGNGVLLARNDDGSWSDPAFVTVASGSIGLQIGGEISEVVLSIMTEDGLNAILDRKAKIGADVSAALFAVGAGVEAHTGLDANADMYAFSRGKGLFVGGALEGGVISERAAWNEAYYGTAASGRDILAGRHSNAQAAPLKAALPR